MLKYARFPIFCINVVSSFGSNPLKWSLLLHTKNRIQVLAATTAATALNAASTLDVLFMLTMSPEMGQVGGNCHVIQQQVP
jgi:hypothetical protein